VVGTFLYILWLDPVQLEFNACVFTFTSPESTLQSMNTL